MPNDSLTIEEVRRMAAEIGLTRLSDEHLQQLLRATTMARERRAALPFASLGPADEPAHMFRPSSVAEHFDDARSLTLSPSPERRGEMDSGNGASTISESLMGGDHHDREDQFHR
jgi:hypothetical protein